MQHVGSGTGPEIKTPATRQPTGTAWRCEGDVNFEYPINNKSKLPKRLEALGTFKEDSLLIEKIAKLAPKAQEIIDKVFW